MNKSAEAFRTIGEVADELDVPKHVLRFWEGKFPQIRPMKRGGGRRYYRPEDMELLRGIRHLLHAEGYTIKGVQKILREQGIDQVKALVRAAIDGKAAKGGSRKNARAAHKDKGSHLPGARTSLASAGEADAPSGRPAGPPGSAAAPAGDLVQTLIRELEHCRALLAPSRKYGEAAGEGKRARAGGRT